VIAAQTAAVVAAVFPQAATAVEVAVGAAPAVQGHSPG